MQTSQLPSPRSTTSLTRNIPPRTNGIDPFHGLENRDFCNVFWGLGEAGPNVLFARMRGAERTTTELQRFWQEREDRDNGFINSWADPDRRMTIEEEYAQRLSKLSEIPIGVEEVGELHVSLSVLRKETEAQAAGHSQLAQCLRDTLGAQTAEFHSKQVDNLLMLQADMEKKLKHRLMQESFAAKAREKYEIDKGRINGFEQQLTYMTGLDHTRVEAKLNRTKETMKANEKDFSVFTQTVVDLLEEWQSQWKDFCDACHDLEEDRMDFMKDILWIYANEVSALCVSDDQSCERLRDSLDQFEPEHDLSKFAEEYGSGNELPQPPSLVSGASSAPVPQYANFQRKSHRVARPYTETDIPFPPVGTQVKGYAQEGSSRHSQATASAAAGLPPGQSPLTTTPVPVPSSSPVVLSSAPMNMLGGPSRAPSMRAPLPGTPATADGTDAPLTSKILFYVEALYDYRATIDEEFDFQAGDVIAVTAAPEDGWWSGELLDEARRVEGKHIFPMNFTRLF